MKLSETRHAINEAENLMQSMMHMIEQQRYIIERYRLMHGNNIYGLSMNELPDDVDYGTTGELGNLKLLRTQNINPQFKQLKTRYNATI